MLAHPRGLCGRGASLPLPSSSVVRCLRYLMDGSGFEAGASGERPELTSRFGWAGRAGDPTCQGSARRQRHRRPDRVHRSGQGEVRLLRLRCHREGRVQRWYRPGNGRRRTTPVRPGVRDHGRRDAPPDAAAGAGRRQRPDAHGAGQGGSAPRAGADLHRRPAIEPDDRMTSHPLDAAEGGWVRFVARPAAVESARSAVMPDDDPRKVACAEVAHVDEHEMVEGDDVSREGRERRPADEAIRPVPVDPRRSHSPWDASASS